MASLAINSVRSALLNLALLDEQLLRQQNPFRTKKLKYFLKNLEIFLLCCRTRGFLPEWIDWIAGTVQGNSLKIQPYCLGLEGGSHFSVVDQIIHNFEGQIQGFEHYIDCQYIALSESLNQPRFPWTDEVSESIDSVSEIIDSVLEISDSVSEIIDSVSESSDSVSEIIDSVSEIIDSVSESSDSVSEISDSVSEIIDSVLENLVVYLSSKFQYVEHSLEPIEAMLEKLTSLRNFIRFVTLRQNTKHWLLKKFWKKFWVHIESVAVNAAHLCFMTQCDFGSEEWSKRMKKIQAANLPVYETYIEALRRSKLSRHLHSRTLEMDRDPIIVTKDFIDFLLWNLWEMLKMGTFLVITFKDQLQLLYEGLRFLRAIHKKQPNKFDEDTRDLTRVVICDAGIVIFSLYQKNVEIDAELSAFYQKNVEIDAELSAFYQENVEIDAKLSDLLGRIELIRSQVEGRVPEISTYNFPRINELLVLGDFQDSFSKAFDSMTEYIRNIKSVALKIFHRGRKDFEIKKVSKTFRLAPSQSIDLTSDEIVGFHDEERSLTNQLIRGSKQLKIVAIVGMPGIGKTTLATKVYNNPSVTYHFHIRARCSVSQLFDKKKVLLELLNNIAAGGNLEMAEQDLAENLWRHLKGKRYLIFLDDIWDIEAWNSLQGSFPDDSRESRIILTSRHCFVVPQAMLSEEPHFLRHLTSDESLELLRRKLFPQTCWPQALYELGKKIAENCKGLPLTIVVVAGLLANLEKEGWKNVLESLSSGISSTEQCKNTLELSYRHLPERLKPCFLYFGLFPEDQEISVQRLVWLWIAEGFVSKIEWKSLEDVASEYMTDLVGRSLVIVAKKRSIGGVRTCRIHDLLHEFCRSKAREENIFHLLKGYDELLSFNEPRNLGRLSIHSQKKHFKNLRLFSPRVHSLLFFVHDEPWSTRGHDISFIIPIYKHLRVLDIGQFNLGFGFPIEMRLLVQLKHLAVKGDIGDIPSSSIDNLSNLETLVVESTKTVSLPETIWDLRSLRHLHIPNGFHIPSENLDNSPVLYELQSCSGAIIHSWENMEKLLRKFPNIRRLKCRIFQLWDTKNCNMILIPDFLSRLESLDVTPSFYSGWHGVPMHFLYEFVFPENLRKLTLNYFKLPQSKISTIGKLPCLEVLKLLDGSFREDYWDVVEGEFSKLRFLKLSHWNIALWTASDSDDQFPCLEKLVLEGLRRLDEVPSCLGNIQTQTLEMIEVRGCSDSVASSVQKIRDVLMEYGYLDLKILISPRSSESS